MHMFGGVGTSRTDNYGTASGGWNGGGAGRGTGAADTRDSVVCGGGGGGY